MKKPAFVSTLFIVCLFMFVSCDKTQEIIQTQPVKKEILSGYVQKGPFITGSAVTIVELDEELNQTGRTYSTTVADNSGSFEQKKIEYGLVHS
jgi:hypothetical protein